jgi:hypothetical protein
MENVYNVVLINYVIHCRKQIQDINWRRKGEQTEAGGKLKQLEER